MQVGTVPRWESRIRSYMQYMSATETRFADYVMEHAAEICRDSIQQIASDCDVSEATIVRFCHKVGYKGFKDFKMAVAQERFVQDASERQNRLLTGDDSMQSTKIKVFAGCIEALQDTMELIDDAELDKAIHILAAAPYVNVFGLGGSASVARNALHSFRKLGIRVNVTSEFTSDYLRVEHFSKNDAALAISISGETESIVNAVRTVKAKNAKVIAITGSTHSTLATLSDSVLLATSRAQMMPGDDTFTRLAQIAVIEAMYAGVAMILREGK